MGLADGRTIEQATDPAGAFTLPWVGPGIVHRAVERSVGSREGVQGQGADDISGAEQPTRVGQGQGADGGRGLRAVDQRQTLFSAE